MALSRFLFKNRGTTWHDIQISDQQQVMLNLWTRVLFVALLQCGDGVKYFHWLRWTGFKPDRQQMGGLYTLNNEFPDQEKKKNTLNSVSRDGSKISMR